MANKKSKVAFHAQSIYDIDPHFFLELGVKAVVTDLDNTLDPADVFHPTDKAKKLVKELLDLGLRVLILSNNTEKRCGMYCKEIQVPYLSSSFKYWAFRIRKFLKKQGLKVEECIFIGDQIYTDRIYVQQLKGRLILTEPLVERDNWVTKIPRFFDRRVREGWRKKGLLGQECPTRIAKEEEK